MPFVISLFFLLAFVASCGKASKNTAPSYPHEVLTLVAKGKLPAVRAFWASPKGQKLPVILFLPGARNERSREEFQVFASLYVPRGYAVLCPASTPSEQAFAKSFVADDPWKDRLRSVARLLSRLRKEKRIDIRRLALVAGEDDRWLAAFLARKLRSAVRVVVLLGAAPSTLLEGLLASKGSKAQGAARVTAELALRKAALRASKAAPFHGATARWWKDRLDRALPLDLGKVTVPILLVRGAREEAGKARAEFLQRSVSITGGASFEELVLPDLDEVWKNSEGDGRFELPLRAAFPFLWKHCKAPKLLEG